jgi:hypothetical protein
LGFGAAPLISQKIIIYVPLNPNSCVWCMQH